MSIVRYRSDEGVRTGAVMIANKWLYWLPVDYPVRVYRIPKSELQYMESLDYSPNKFRKTIRRMIRAGQTPVSKNVKRVLKEAI